MKNNSASPYHGGNNCISRNSSSTCYGDNHCIKCNFASPCHGGNQRMSCNSTSTCYGGNRCMSCMSASACREGSHCISRNSSSACYVGIHSIKCNSASPYHGGNQHRWCNSASLFHAGMHDNLRTYPFAFHGGTSHEIQELCSQCPRLSGHPRELLHSVTERTVHRILQQEQSNSASQTRPAHNSHLSCSPSECFRPMHDLQNRCLRKRLPNQGHTSTTATAYHLVQRTRLTVSSLRTEKSKHVSAARLARSRMHRGQSNSSTAKSWPSTLSEMPSASDFSQGHRDDLNSHDQPANIEGLKELRQPCARHCKVLFDSRACKLHRIAVLSLRERLAAHPNKSDCAKECKHAEINVKPYVSTQCARIQTKVRHPLCWQTCRHLWNFWPSAHSLLWKRPSEHPWSDPGSAPLSSTIVADDWIGQVQARPPCSSDEFELLNPMPST